MFSFLRMQGQEQDLHGNPYIVDSLNAKNLSQLDKQVLDSVLPLYQKAQQDSVKLKHLWFIVENTWSIRVWPKFNQLMYDISERNLRNDPNNPVFLSYKGNAINNFGFFNKEKENASLALKHYLDALTIAQLIHDDRLEATCLNNIGFIYQTMLGAPAKALNYYQKSMEINQRINDMKTYAVTLANVGSIYFAQNDTAKAHQNYKESLKIREQEQDLEGIARVSKDLARFKLATGHLDEALNYAYKSLKVERRLGLERGVSENLLIIGEIYDERSNSDSALKYFQDAMQIDIAIKNKTGHANALLYIGQHYSYDKQYEKSLEYFLQANKLYQESKIPEKIVRSALSLSKVYESLGMHKESLKFYKAFRTSDSLIHNQKIEKQIIRQNLQAEFDTKEAFIEKQMAITKEREQSKNIILFISVICLVLVLALLVFLYSRFKVIRGQKDLILKQQTLLEFKNRDLNVKNKQVSDSINYAQYIAQTIFPSHESLDTNFKDHFVLFEPKDIVSGDFYWSHQIDENNIVLVVADCTGHGVPGSMLSLICASILDNVIVQNNILEPHQILDQFYEELISKMNRHSKDEKLNDGVEMSVCYYNKLKNELILSASYHKMYFIDNGELTEFAGDKIQITRKNLESGNEFTRYILQPNEGSMLYLFSDGFVDQKGGVNKKKYYYAPFRDLLSSISDKSMEQQKESLKKELKEWRGMIEQYDDIMIFGIRF